MPVRVRTTVVENVTVGGDGPNPSDAFSVRFGLSDTSTTPTDATVFALLFPETTSAPTDSVVFRLAFPDANAAPTDGLGSLTVTHSDTSPSQTDAVSLRVTFAETNTAPTDVLSLRLVITDTSAGQTETHALRITHSETTSAPTDGSTFALRPSYNDPNTAPTDAHLLRVSGLSDASVAPTDARSATAVWTAGATTATQTGSWTSPANAQGSNNGTVATLSDTALNANAGTLTLDPYPDPDASFSSWTITEVRVLAYMNFTVGANVGSSSHLEYSENGSAWTLVQTFPQANANNLTTPRSLVLSGSWTWTRVNNLRFRVRHVSGTVTDTTTIEVDAVLLQVTATKNPL